MISAGLMAFMLPLSSMIFTADFIAQTTPEITSIPGQRAQAAAAGHAIGAIIGGSMITFITGVFGFIVGVIFLVIGFNVGKDPRIVVIHERQDKDDPHIE